MVFKTMRHCVFAIAFVTSGFGTTSAALGVEPEFQTINDAPRCVRLRNINGYTVLDNQHLILKGSASRHYLVTLRSRCFGLDGGAQILTSFGDNARLCRPFFAHVQPNGGARCPIESIEEVHDRQAANQRIEDRANADESD